MSWVFVTCEHPDPFTLRFGYSSWLSFGCPPLMPFTGSSWADALEVVGDQAWPVGLRVKKREESTDSSQKKGQQWQIRT